MDSSGFEALRRSILASLDSISQSTEEVYVGMATAYPSLIRELESGFRSTGAEARDALTETIQTTLDGISARETAFARGHEDSSLAVQTLSRQLDRLGELEDSVKAIREDAALMELVSLNAMVAGVKAGNAGRAFSSITSELKQLSSQTMDLADEIARRQESLHQVFAEFQAELQKADDEAAAAFSSFLDNIRGAFGTLQADGRGILDGLDSIRRRSEDVKSPLTRVMVGVQNQDSIRQGLDHVRLSLRELDLEASDERARLDQLSFLEILPELSAQVLDEIRARIQENRAQFSLQLAEARRQIGHLEDERRTVLDTQKSGARGLDQGFLDVEAIIVAFNAANDALGRHREAAFRRGAALQRRVGDLVGTLRSFDFVNSKFRAIDVASRIEVARQSALASMRNNTAEMTALTGQIERDVGGAIGVAGQFFSNVESIFATYRERYEERRDRDADLKSELDQAIGRLKSAHELLTRSLGNAQVFTSAFLEQLGRTERDLGQLDTLVGTIDEQLSGLTALKERIGAEKRALLNQQGLDAWVLSNEQLKTVVSRFTMFTHKKIAADLGHFEVEDSVESGEVTLF